MFGAALRAACRAPIMCEAELRLQSCRNTGAPFNKIENTGDVFLSKVGPGVMKNFMERVGQSNAEVNASFTAGTLHANVGLGPWFAEAFGLRVVFPNEAGVVMSEEVAAGLLEAVMGAVERAGMQRLLEGFVMFGGSVFLAIAWEEMLLYSVPSASVRPEISMLRKIDSLAVDACRTYHAHLLPGTWFPSFVDGIWRHFDSLHLLDCLMDVHTGLLRYLFTPTIQLVDAAPVEVPIARNVTCQQIHPHGQYVRWLMFCIEANCNRELVTSWCLDDCTCLEEAKSKGWKKSLSKSWRDSSRCPDHAW